MKIQNYIVPFFFFLTMISFEVMRDFSFFSALSSADAAELADVGEEDNIEKEGKSVEEPRFEGDINFEELSSSSYLREQVWYGVIQAHDLNYQLLEQKVVSPPPESLFS